jgi:hypothetical protein
MGMAKPVPQPGPEEFIEAIALWIREEYERGDELEVGACQSTGDIVLSLPDLPALLTLYCAPWGMRVGDTSIQLPYEHPKFFQQLTEILNHLLKHHSIHDLDPYWGMHNAEDVEEVEYVLPRAPKVLGSPRPRIFCPAKSRVRIRGPPVSSVPLLALV